MPSNSINKSEREKNKSQKFISSRKVMTKLEKLLKEAQRTFLLFFKIWLIVLIAMEKRKYLCSSIFKKYYCKRRNKSEKLNENIEQNGHG